MFGKRPFMNAFGKRTTPPPAANVAPDPNWNPRDWRAGDVPFEQKPWHPITASLTLNLSGRDDRDRQRIVHNLAQAAQSLSAVAHEIDPLAMVEACEGHYPVAVEKAARNEDNTLAKALHAMPRGAAIYVMGLLLMSEPGMARHPGVIGFLKLLKAERKARRDAQAHR